MTPPRLAVLAAAAIALAGCAHRENRRRRTACSASATVDRCSWTARAAARQRCSSFRARQLRRAWNVAVAPDDPIGRRRTTSSNRRGWAPAGRSAARSPNAVGCVPMTGRHPAGQDGPVDVGAATAHRRRRRRRHRGADRCGPAAGALHRGGALLRGTGRRLARPNAPRPRQCAGDGGPGLRVPAHGGQPGAERRLRPRRPGAGHPGRGRVASGRCLPSHRRCPAPAECSCCGAEFGQVLSAADAHPGELRRPRSTGPTTCWPTRCHHQPDRGRRRPQRHAVRPGCGGRHRRGRARG